MGQLWKDWQLFAGETGEEDVPDAGEQEDFETLIRGRYKEAFDARVQKILEGRLKNLRQENLRLRQTAEEQRREAAWREMVRQQREEEQLRRAMDFAVSRTRQQMAQAIASGGSRVAENGGRRRSVSRCDPRELSGKELAEIRKRVLEGERISF